MNTITINEETIHFEDIGEGTPLICIHPPGMGRKVFYEQKPLSKHFRLIMLDLAGQGDSTYRNKTEISVKRFGEDIIEFMDKLRIQSAVLFGYSSGGAIAQYLTIHYPSRVQSLILSGGYPIVDHLLIKNEHRLGIVTAKNTKKLLSRLLAFAHTKDKEYRKVLREHMNKSDGSVWAASYNDVMNFCCKDELNQITVPVLLMYGSKSDIYR